MVKCIFCYNISSKNFARMELREIQCGECGHYFWQSWEEQKWTALINRDYFTNSALRMSKETRRLNEKGQVPIWAFDFEADLGALGMLTKTEPVLINPNFFKKEASDEIG